MTVDADDIPGDDFGPNLGGAFGIYENIMSIVEVDGSWSDAD